MRISLLFLACVSAYGSIGQAGSGGGGTPGGSDGDVQCNNMGMFGGCTTTGSGSVVRATSPTLVTPALGTPSALVLTNATGLPLAGIVNITGPTVLGRTSGSGAPQELTPANMQTILNGQGPNSPFWSQANSGGGTEILTYQNTTASTGNTHLVVKVGAVSCGTCFEVLDSSSASQFTVGYRGDVTVNRALYITNGAGTGSTNQPFSLGPGSNFSLQSGSVIGWCSTASTNCFSGGDTSISRAAANVLAVGTGSAGSTAASLRAASYQSGGTKFTASGCSNSTTVGGATAGTFVSGTTGTCTVTITMNGATGLTAPNGWSCHASDQTTPANLIAQSASSTTTATITGTTVTNDVISFSCMAF